MVHRPPFLKAGNNGDCEKAKNMFRSRLFYLTKIDVFAIVFSTLSGTENKNDPSKTKGEIQWQTR